MEFVLIARPQVALVHPDRVEHADIWQLAGLAQAIDGGDAHEPPDRTPSACTTNAPNEQLLGAISGEARLGPSSVTC